MDFYNFFSFSAKKAIYRASEICVQFNNQYLEPEHIFFSILNLRSSLAVTILEQLHANLPKMNYALEAHLYENAGSFRGTASFSTRTLNLLDESYRMLKQLRHREIGTAHLLLALSADRKSFLRELFASHQLSSKSIRNTFMTHLQAHEIESLLRDHGAEIPIVPAADLVPPVEPEASGLYDDRTQELFWLAGFLAQRLRHAEFGIPHLMYAFMTRDGALQQTEQIYKTGPLRPGSVLVKLVAEIDTLDPLPEATEPQKSDEVIKLISLTLEWSLKHTGSELIEYTPFTTELLTIAQGQYQSLLAGCVPDTNRAEPGPDTAEKDAGPGQGEPAE